MSLVARSKKCESPYITEIKVPTYGAAREQVAGLRAHKVSRKSRFLGRVRVFVNHGIQKDISVMCQSIPRHHGLIVVHRNPQDVAFFFFKICEETGDNGLRLIPDSAGEFQGCKTGVVSRSVRCSIVSLLLQLPP